MSGFAPIEFWPFFLFSRCFCGKTSSQNHFHQKPFSSKSTFIKNHFHQKPLSSKNHFHQNATHQNATFIKNHFHQKPLSSKTIFFKNQFHQRPSSETNFITKPFSSKTNFIKNQFHQSTLSEGPCETVKNNIVRVCVKASRAEGPRHLHTNTCAHLWGLSWP